MSDTQSIGLIEFETAQNRMSAAKVFTAMNQHVQKFERELKEQHATALEYARSSDTLSQQLTESRAEAMTYKAVANLLYSALHDTNPHFVKLYGKHSPERLLKGYDELHAKNRNAMDAFAAAEESR